MPDVSPAQRQWLGRAKRVHVEATDTAVGGCTLIRLDCSRVLQPVTPGPPLAVEVQILGVPHRAKWAPSLAGSAKASRQRVLHQSRHKVAVGPDGNFEEVEGSEKERPAVLTLTLTLTLTPALTLTLTLNPNPNPKPYP